MLPILTAALLAAVPASPSSSAVANTEAAQAEVIKRGAPLSGQSPKVPFAEVAREPAKYAGKTVTVDGVVRKACSRKGCWMELSESSDAKAFGARVTFKDYGFFVPLDSQGAKATVEGVVEIAKMSEKQAKHLEEEGAQIPRDAEGRPSELRIVATGVELKR